MRTLLIIAATMLAATMTCAFAQTSDMQSGQMQSGQAQSGPQNPAVKTDSGNNSSTPVAGANSFTRGEAASRIAAQGYSSVAHLEKDRSGVWRGMAKKDGQLVNVSLDFQGNVTAD